MIVNVSQSPYLFDESLQVGNQSFRGTLMDILLTTK